MKRLLFTIYLLLYFRFAQYDVSGYWLSLVAGHFVEPWPWTMALVATGVLLLVLCLTERLLAHWHKPVIVAYAIVAWLATAGVGMAFTTVWHQLLLAAGGLVLAWLLMITDKHLRHRSRITPQTFGVNFQFFAVQMLLLCLYVGVGNGVSDLQHYELRTAQALQSKHPKRAYKVGDKSYATSHRLFAMRCYLMATTQKRGWATRCSAKWCQPVVPPVCYCCQPTITNNCCCPHRNLKGYWAAGAMLTRVPLPICTAVPGCQHSWEMASTPLLQTTTCVLYCSNANLTCLPKRLSTITPPRWRRANCHAILHKRSYCTNAHAHNPMCSIPTATLRRTTAIIPIWPTLYPTAPFALTCCATRMAKPIGGGTATEAAISERPFV